MNTLLNIITRLKGRIEGGSAYGWDCFGPNARFLDFPNVGVVFDSVTQEVYAVDAWPNNYDDNAKSIIWVNHEYEVAHRAETACRNAHNNMEQCYSFQAILTIAEAVMNEQPFDKGLLNDVEIFLAPKELDMILRAAELSNMTLDEFVNTALLEKLKLAKNS